MRLIFVTGGVLSGLGKGVTVSSIGLLLKSRGFDVTAIKIDPYLNVDAGTINPYEHGEVFVLNDGGEVDQDLGNYERFLNVNLTKDHNITTGKVYSTVISAERKGKFLGQTVQIIPHITNEIKKRIIEIAKGHDITLVEVGGTVGDIESMPFLEAIRQIKNDYPNKVLFIHTTYVPELVVVGEQKTKPTQHSVRELRSIGIQPDMIVARSRRWLEEKTIKKISLYSNLKENAVISAPDVNTIYKIPLLFEKQGVTNYILNRLKLKGKKSDMLEKLKELIKNIENAKREVKIGLVGKYTKLKDAYISHNEAFVHISANTGIRVKEVFIESEKLENKSFTLEGLDGILIPGGFGSRGIEGKINAIKYARENKIPILGICLGFQLMVVEYARNVLGLKANSTEFEKKTRNPVIDILPEQIGIKSLGGTMRLGSKKVIIKRGTQAFEIYKKKIIYERHRHRYEVNPKYVSKLENAGLIFSATDEERKRMEMLELKNQFFIGSQFHPEFKSRLMNPSKLHLALVLSAFNQIHN